MSISFMGEIILNAELKLTNIILIYVLLFSRWVIASSVDLLVLQTGEGPGWTMVGVLKQVLTVDYDSDMLKMSVMTSTS